MKSQLTALCFLACAIGRSSGAAPAVAATPPSTNTLIIVSEFRSEFTPTNVFWLGRVRAGDGEIYLECERLTAYFNTNSIRTNTAAKANVPRRTGEKENDTKFELLVAETNVMIISGGRQIVGDHAEYHATNDFLFVTGKPVIVEDSAGMMICDKFTHDRQSGRTEFLGQNLFIGNASLMSRTNSPSKNSKTNAPSASK
jgi:hypothetical protein